MEEVVLVLAVDPDVFKGEVALEEGPRVLVRNGRSEAPVAVVDVLLIVC
jgi:hypothetical protein